MKKYLFIICALFFLCKASNLFADCHWLQDLSNVSVNCMVVHPTNPQIMYVGSLNVIYLSIDGAVTWLPMNISFPLSTLVIGNSSPNILYAGSTIGRMYKTTDNALSWIEVSTGITETSRVQAIAVKPIDPNTVVIALFDGTNNATNGIYKTTNKFRIKIYRNKKDGADKIMS